MDFPTADLMDQDACYQKLLREDKNQEPAPGGPAEFQIQGAAEERTPPQPRPTPLATVAPATPADSKREAVCSLRDAVVSGAETSQARVEPGRTVPPRPVVIAGGAGGPPLPTPTLNDVRVEELKDTGRLLQLHDQAVARGFVGSSEADRLRFVGAAEHAMAVGKGNPPGLFCHLVRGRLWRYLTQDDEDAAGLRLKRHLFGPPRGGGPGGSRSAVAVGPGLSRDAMLVLQQHGISCICRRVG